MLQQIMTEPGNIVFKEIDIPEISDNQLLIKNKRIGIC